MATSNEKDSFSAALESAMRTIQGEWLLPAKPKTNEEARRKKVKHVEVERLGEKLVIPENVSYDEAIASIQRIKEQQEQDIAIDSEIDCSVPDGAHALYMVLNEKFGWVNLEKTPGFFSDRPPTMMTVQVGVDKSIQVPWGQMTLPGLSGHIQPGYHEKPGMYKFAVQGTTKRKHEAQIMEIVDEVRAYVRKNSIYRGSAVGMRFSDDCGNLLPVPETAFLNTSSVDEADLVFSSDVSRRITESIFTPIEHTDVCRMAGVPLKRGVLLEGPYGCGKTLTAAVAAKKAQANGWTYIYCERADELKYALAFAQQYGPAVLFCEDLDRVVSGDRSISMDEVLNIIDGVGSKSAELLVVLTTNHVEKINQAMLRPGRLDAVISVTAPDEEAAIRLVRTYAREQLDPEEDISEVGDALAGMIPAVIREVVERSKLSAIALSGGKAIGITKDALLEAATSMQRQLDLLNREQEKSEDPQIVSAKITAKAIEGAFGSAQTNGKPAKELVTR